VSRHEEGESLVELIIAMAILGTSMVTIVAGFLSLSKISGVQHDQGSAFAALTSASEYAKARACVATATCGLESAVPSSLVPHDADTTVTVAAPSLVTLVAGGPAVTRFVVTVTTGSAVYRNTVVVR